MRDLTTVPSTRPPPWARRYADVRVIRRIEESINIKSTRVEGVQSGETEGFGVRVLVDGAWGFAASHHLSTARGGPRRRRGRPDRQGQRDGPAQPRGARRAPAGPRPLRDAGPGGPVRRPARSQDRRPAGGRPGARPGEGHRVHGEPVRRPARVEDVRRQRRQLHRAGHHPHRRGPRGQRDRGRRAPAPQLPRQRRPVGVGRLRVRPRHGPRGQRRADRERGRRAAQRAAAARRHAHDRAPPEPAVHAGPRELRPPDRARPRLRHRGQLRGHELPDAGHAGRLPIRLGPRETSSPTRPSPAAWARSAGTTRACRPSGPTSSRTACSSAT